VMDALRAVKSDQVRFELQHLTSQNILTSLQKKHVDLMPGLLQHGGKGHYAKIFESEVLNKRYPSHWTSKGDFKDMIVLPVQV
jgi:hypothetical protein